MNEHGLTGKKIRLKALGEEDLKYILFWKNDYELANLIISHPLPTTEYEINDWFKKIQYDKNQILFGIYDISSNKILGIVRLMFIDWVSSTAEFGMFIGSNENRGKGYGKEVVNIIKNYAFNDLNLYKIYLKTLESNVKALLLWKSCGFIKEGTLKNHFWSKGKYENITLMGVFKNE
jgi:RimJ/RimL family protein N-acetyltransferase